MRLFYGALGVSFVRGAGAMKSCLDPRTASPLGSTNMSRQRTVPEQQRSNGRFLFVAG
ncbi:unnamed protein product [Ectocarpus sp. 6 AP-2014]